MLQALAEDGTYRELLAGVKEMPDPEPAMAPASDPDNETALRNLRIATQQEFYGAFSFWWVSCSECRDEPARALMWRGMPSSMEYAMLLGTGHAVQESQISGSV